MHIKYSVEYPNLRDFYHIYHSQPNMQINKNFKKEPCTRMRSWNNIRNEFEKMKNTKASENVYIKKLNNIAQRASFEIIQ